MTFEELGTALRSEREKRGVSIDDVATYLKISGRVIRALEEGDTASLPHAVYVRGFIRSYGAYLGLSGDELAEAMDTVAPEEPPANPQSVYAPVDASGSPAGKILCSLALLGCLVGLGAFWYYRDADLFSDEGGHGVIPATAQPAPPVSSPQSPAPSPAKTVQPIARPAETAPPPAATPPVPQQTAPSFPQTPPPAAQQPVAAAQQEPSGQHKIIITALAECWIHSNADDTDTRQFSLRKGDTFALAFSKKLTLKLGNAGGVRIRYDGQELPAPGGDGQVRTLTFPPAQP